MNKELSDYLRVQEAVRMVDGANALKEGGYTHIEIDGEAVSIHETLGARLTDLLKPHA